MAATVTEVTRVTIVSDTYQWLSSTLGLVTILLLITLLIQKELVRAYGGSRSKTWMRALDVAIVPLVLAAGLVMFLRLIDLLIPL